MNQADYILRGDYCPDLRAGWVRLFGYGLAVRDLRRSPLLFSERNGYAIGLRVGWLLVKVLMPY